MARFQWKLVVAVKQNTEAASSASHAPAVSLSAPLCPHVRRIQNTECCRVQLEDASQAGCKSKCYSPPNLMFTPHWMLSDQQWDGHHPQSAVVLLCNSVKLKRIVYNLSQWRAVQIYFYLSSEYIPSECRVYQIRVYPKWMLSISRVYPEWMPGK